MKFIVPDTPDLALDQVDWPEEVQLVKISENESVPEAHQDAEACMLWGMVPSTYKFVAQLPNVKWFQSLAAGPDGLMNSKLGKDVLVTNGMNFHDKTVAEHTLSLTLALARRIPESLEYQKQHEWSTLGGKQPLHPEDRVTTLLDAKVIVWGFGQIGQEIARRFSAMGSEVTGVARSKGERSGFPTVTETEMREMLPETDVLIMVLPNNDSTQDALDTSILQLLPKRALVVNVGRGNTVNEEDLRAALENKEIAGAAVDVVKNEPLSPDSPLWDTPGLLITPHSAGGRPYGLKERIEHNLACYLEGRIDEMIGVLKRPEA